MAGAQFWAADLVVLRPAGDPVADLGEELIGQADRGEDAGAVRAARRPEEREQQQQPQKAPDSAVVPAAVPIW